MPNSSIAGSDGKHIFSFLRDFHIIFQSNCAILLSYQGCVNDPDSLTNTYLKKKKNLQ